MQTFKFSREVILGLIRSNLPNQQVEHPRIPVFQRPVMPLKPEFDSISGKPEESLTMLAPLRRPRSS
jgi:hypothetical protein